MNKIEIFSDNDKFENFVDKKRDDIEIIADLSQVITPTSHFVFYRFKDTLKVSDFGQLQEVNFRLPSALAQEDKNSPKLFIFGDDAFNSTLLRYDIYLDEWRSF